MSLLKPTAASLMPSDSVRYGYKVVATFSIVMPQVLVPDNLKAAVTKASRYEPDINRAMEDFANHYHTTVVELLYLTGGI